MICLAGRYKKIEKKDFFISKLHERKKIGKINMLYLIPINLVISANMVKGNLIG